MDIVSSRLPKVRSARLRVPTTAARDARPSSRGIPKLDPSTMSPTHAIETGLPVGAVVGASLAVVVTGCVAAPVLGTPASVRARLGRRGCAAT